MHRSQYFMNFKPIDKGMPCIAKYLNGHNNNKIQVPALTADKTSDFQSFFSTTTQAKTNIA